MSIMSRTQLTNYCPTCLNDTLSINSRGMIEIVVNGKKMDAGHFIYNLGKDSPDEVFSTFRKKLEDFFSWYGQFQNKLPIKSVEIVSGDFTCDKKCHLDLNYKASVVDLIIPRPVVDKALKELAEKYDLVLAL
ncbi:MAG: hypothetical protein AABY86_07110 [Bdellovibrionota bacterium]